MPLAWAGMPKTSFRKNSGALDFVWGEVDFSRALAIIEAKGAEVIVLVANSREGTNLFEKYGLN